MDRAGDRMSLLVCFGLLTMVPVAAACPNTAGVVIGSIVCTIVVMGAILAIVGYILYKRRQKAKAQRSTDGVDGECTKKNDLGHTNPTFEGDVEAGTANATASTTTPRKVNEVDHNDKGFPGYVECREYESPVKQVKASLNDTGAVQATLVHDAPDGASPISFPMRKTGSHGSLDNSYSNLDADIVSVDLESHDIIGLGFNIEGSMSKGMFISQLHQRGPASESGQINIGDRILSVTVSFENIVYEDALTILSYASPYPVHLRLQRATSAAAAGAGAAAGTTREAGEVDCDDSKGKINHPVYRSQSMDDLRKVGSDGYLLHPRRTWSEMKKPGYVPPKPSGDEGMLKKWRAKQDIVQEESSEAGDQYQSSNSNFSVPDLKIDMSLDFDSLDKTGTETSVVEIDGPESDLQKDAVKLSHKASSEGELNMNIGELNAGNSPQDLSPKDIETKIEVEVEPITMKTPLLVAHSDKRREDINGEVDGEMDSVLPHVKYEGVTMAAPPVSMATFPAHAEVEAESKAAPPVSMATFPVDMDHEVEASVRSDQVQPSSTVIAPDVIVAGKRPLEVDTVSFDSGIPQKPDRKKSKSMQESSESEDSESEDGAKRHEDKDRLSLGAHLGTELPNVEVKANGNFPQYKPLELASVNVEDEDIPVTKTVNLSNNNSGVIEPRLQLESYEKLLSASKDEDDDQVRAVIRDYFGDKPALLEQFGIRRDNDESPQIVEETVEVTQVQKGGEIIVTRKETIATSDGVTATQIAEVNTQILSKDELQDFMEGTPNNEDGDILVAKMARVKSSDTSSESSVTSSRSSSPERPEPVHEAQTEEEKEQDRIRRKSGGLAYDFTAVEFNDLPNEIAQKPRGDPKGGVAYYVSIDEHGSPAHAIRPLSPNVDVNADDRPALIRPQNVQHPTSVQTRSVSGDRTVDRLDKTMEVQKLELMKAKDVDDNSNVVPTKSSHMTVRLSSSSLNDEDTGLPSANEQKTYSETITVIKHDELDSEA